MLLMAEAMVKPCLESLHFELSSLALVPGTEITDYFLLC